MGDTDSQPSQQPLRRYVPADPKALGIATDIDRRQCSRVVPLKVMCLGISRTGTCSVRQALLDLGYNDVYHYAAMLNENPRDAVMWEQALEAKLEGKGHQFEKKDWDQLLGHCEAITDNPCIIFYKELLQAYPEALIILTVRDSAEQWWNSVNRTLIPFLDGVFPRTLSGKALAWFFNLFRPSPREPERAMNRVFALQDVHTPYFTTNVENAIEYYHWYNNEIKRLVPPERLLVFNVKQGWKPLCDFLEKSVPDWPFPKSNDTVVFNKNVSATQKIFFSQILRNIAKSSACIGVLVSAVWMFSARTRL